MSKFYPEIVLGGDDFSPQKIIERYKVNIEHMHEKGDYNIRLKSKWRGGEGILRPKTDNTNENVIIELLKDYQLIMKDDNNGIEYAYFNLLVEAIQCNTVFYSDIIIEICRNFKEFNVSFIEKEGQ